MNRAIAVFASFALAAAAYAQQTEGPKCCDSKSQTAQSKTPGCCDAAKAGCSKGDKSETLVKDMPTLSYKVGDKTTCCPKEAETLANGDKAAMKFVVADKTYDNATDAQTAYADALNAYYEKMTTVQYVVGENCMACPVSAGEMAKKEGKPVRYRLASLTFDKQDLADKAAAAARKAGDGVEMKTSRGGKSCCAATAAKAEPSKDSEPVEYTVGETTTRCPIEAKVNLAKARIMAAAHALSENAGA